MAIGFIGTGAITEAIIIGLYTRGAYTGRILVSRRSRERSTILAERFPQVEVVDNNQSLVDRSDELFVAVLPEQVADVLGALEFKASHRVVSLVAGLSLDELSSLVGPAMQCFRVIPMPPVEFGIGPTPVCPPDAKLQSLFDTIGNAIPVDDESLFTVFSSSTAVMASYFELVANIAAWMQEEGVDAKQATLYVTSMVNALSKLTTRVDAEKLQRMSEACLTA
ncbi:MAG: NAD(P)-binding domain-containing protein, partial [Pseudomonadota bacterium]